MKNAIINSVVVVVGLLVPHTAWSQGTLYVSSLDQPSAGSAAVGSDSWNGEGFITGSNPGGYVFDSIQLAMTPATGNPSDFMVQLYTSAQYAGGFAPGSSIATLTGSSDPVTAGLYTYTASGLTLPSSHMYFIVLTAGTPIASGSYAWSYENASPATSKRWLERRWLSPSQRWIHWMLVSDTRQTNFSLT